ARKCDGLVYPPIFTAFAGATRLYPGTVPFSYEFHAQVLKATVRSLHAQGFGRIFLLCYTNPEDAAGLVAARDLFDTEGELPVASLVATRGLTSEPVKKLLSEYKGSAGEALIDYAAMRLLGHERPVAEPELARAGLRGGEDQPKEIREAVRILRARGTRGFRYDSEREHASHGTVGLTFRGRPDIELGLMILDALADYLLPAVDALRRHQEYLRRHPPRRIERQGPPPPPSPPRPARPRPAPPARPGGNPRLTAPPAGGGRACPPGQARPPRPPVGWGAPPPRRARPSGPAPPPWEPCHGPRNRLVASAPPRPLVRPR